MSISRIGGHGPSRGVDLAMLFREYMDQEDSRAAAAAAPAAQDNGSPPPPPLSPVKAIDNPRRGALAFLNRVESPTENRVRSKRSKGNAGEVLQGDLPHWNRMDAQDYQALEAIPGTDESEAPVRVDKAHMRRVGELAVDRGKARPAAEAPAPAGKKAQRKRSLGASQGLRDRARFVRQQGLSSPVPPQSILVGGIA